MDHEKFLTYFGDFLIGRENGEEILGNIEPTILRSGKKGLEIYRKNFQGCWLSALSAHFPVTKKVLGETCFRGAGLKYLKAFPPKTACFRQYSKDFSHFCAGQPGLAPLSYLSDLMMVEWHWENLFWIDDERKSGEESRFAPDHDRSIDSMFLQLPTTTVLLYSNYPTFRIWKAVKESEGDIEEISMGNEKSRIVLFRNIQDSVICRGVQEPLWQLLKLLKEGGTLSDIKTKLSGSEEKSDLMKILPALDIPVNILPN